MLWAIVIISVALVCFILWVNSSDDEMLVKYSVDHYISKLTSKYNESRESGINLVKIFRIMDLNRYCSEAINKLKDNESIIVNHKGQSVELIKTDLYKPQFIAARLKCLDIDYVTDAFNTNGVITECAEGTIANLLTNNKSIGNYEYMVLCILMLTVINNQNFIVKDPAVNEMLNLLKEENILETFREIVAHCYGFTIDGMDDVVVDLLESSEDSIVSTIFILSIIATFQQKFKYTTEYQRSFAAQVYTNEIRSLLLFIDKNIRELVKHEKIDFLQIALSKFIESLGWYKGI